MVLSAGIGRAAVACALAGLLLAGCGKGGEAEKPAAAAASGIAPYDAKGATGIDAAKAFLAAEIKDQSSLTPAQQDNFMGSTLVRIAQGDPPAQTLAFVAGLAVIEALRPHCEGLRLKWPNDVLLGSGKLAGVLLEAEGDAVIIGIGVNLASAPPIADRPVVCLPKPVARDRFAEQLAECFTEQIVRWRTYGVEPLLIRWSATAHPPGEMLTVHEPGGRLLSGTFGGLAPDGALLLRLADGSVSAIHAGDVTIEGQ